MNHQETQTLIHGYLDGELDLLSNLEIERHLADCAKCTQILENYQSMRTALRSSKLYYSAPASLRQQVRSSVHRAERPAFGLTSLSVAAGWSNRAILVGLAAGLALILIAAWSLLRGVSAPTSADLLTQEVIASHVRSLMVNHIADVPSSDQHTVKPWFNGKLDFSPWVEDLASQGFPLTGGRLDYLDNQAVAALIYRRNLHYINLFIWPVGQEADTDLQIESRQGFNLIHWNEQGMTYWAISDLNTSELQEFAQLVQHHASLSTTP